jgi:hypothetical protein
MHWHHVIYAKFARIGRAGLVGAVGAGERYGVTRSTTSNSRLLERRV